MRLTEATMTAVVVAALIVTAPHPAVAQPTAGEYLGNPSYALIDMSLDDGMTPYWIGSDVGAAGGMPFAVDSGVLLSNNPGWSPSYKLPGLAAVEPAGSGTPLASGTASYPAGSAPVPEPASVAMLVAGLATLTVAAWLRARRAG
jgi:hypothetical protein